MKQLAIIALLALSYLYWLGSSPQAPIPYVHVAIYNQGVAPNQGEPITGSFVSTPIAIGNDDCGWNVAVALDANSAALQRVTLQPGQTFSFNATMGNPELLDYRSCSGVPGGNWCNLAARYAQVARAKGLPLQFLHHNVDLGAGIENDVLIWNIDGQPGFDEGRQDLLITNTTNNVVMLQTQQQDNAVVVIVS